MIIIGNSEYSGVKIENNKVFEEFLINNNFKVVDSKRRTITAKNLSPFRDEKGRFTNAQTLNSKRIYQHEHVLIAQKGA